MKAFRTTIPRGKCKRGVLRLYFMLRRQLLVDNDKIRKDAEAVLMPFMVFTASEHPAKH